MEDALGVAVDGPLRALRRLLYCGEWIESHALHVYMLHAPDFLGYEGAIELARDHRRRRQARARAEEGRQRDRWRWSAAARSIRSTCGSAASTRRRRGASSRPLAERLERARDAALETVRWVAGFDFPDCERDYEFVVAPPSRRIPVQRGPHRLEPGPRHRGARVRRPLRGDARRRTRTRCTRGSRRAAHYLVGPLARYSLNFDRLSPLAQQAAREAGLGPVCRNPFQSIVVRAVEVLYACDEALRIIASLRGAGPAGRAGRAARRHRPCRAPRRRAACSTTATGSPTTARSWMRGSCRRPRRTRRASRRTSRSFVGGWLDLPDEALRWRCEQTVRNYDPCISCATHFLDLEIDRG